MPQNMSTPTHCPGFENLRNLSSFVCRCPNCGKENEIFSDEFNRPHSCGSCGESIDFSQCTVASDTSPR